MLSKRAHLKHNTLCTGFHTPLLRARPALRLPTVLRQSAAVRTGVDGYNPRVSCQHGLQPMRRPASTHTQVRVEEDTVESVPAWRKMVSFLLKSSAVVALALALVSPSLQLQHSLLSVVLVPSSWLYPLQTFGSVSSAEAARSGGRMGGSGFSAARSGSSSYSR